MIVTPCGARGIRKPKARACACPTHDVGADELVNTGTTGHFHCTQLQDISVDLFSAMLAWNLAATEQVLGAALPDSTRATLRANVHRRVLAPFLAMRAGHMTTMPWWTFSNNWNAVCLAGVTGAALGLVAARIRIVCQALP